MTEGYTALWSYAWDLMAGGVDITLERIATTGVKGVSLATSYHAGMVMLPHNPQQKVRFLEDGSLYFRPDPQLFGQLEIQPRVSALTEQFDPLEDICFGAKRQGLEVTSWTVCCHNSYLGSLHPELTIHNAFGDPYLFALCPSQPAVQAYLEALLANLSQYPLRTLQLESYDYMGFYHGYHHEKVQLELGAAAAMLMGICFCDACRQAATERGMDPVALQEAVAAWLVHSFESEVDDPSEATHEVLGALVPGMAAYLAMRDELTIKSLKGLIAASSVPLNLLGVKPQVLTAVQGQIAEITTCAYVGSAEEVTQATSAARKLAGDTHEVGVGLEISPKFTPTAANMAEKVSAARQAGADNLYFYNYGLVPMRSLGWLRMALRG
ncbi:MAG: hypothetical protein GXY52_02115 [Chloroflexi bacterium]|nr:hypothetical protein [Chloroflexota bacterium]